jgi:hypothetical protein
VNAAFLLLTSAWLAGDVAAPAAGCGGGCGASCGASCNDSCCDAGCGRVKLCDRLKGLFNRRRCCDSGNDCCAAPAQTCCAAPKTTCCAAPAQTCCQSSCDDGCGKKWGGKFRGLFKRKGCCDSCDTCAQNTCGTCGSSCDSCCDDCGARKWGGKLRGLFHRKGCCDSGCDSCSTGCATGACGGAAPAKGEPIPAPKEAPKKMPTGEKPATQALIPTPASPYLSAPETKSPFELSRRYEARVTNAPDYSSLTGQLFFVHADGGLWVLRYAPVWKEDQFGGSVVLARDLRMDSFREGDLVTVRGEILDRGRTKYVGGPLYRGQAITLIDRVEN